MASRSVSFSVFVSGLEVREPPDSRVLCKQFRLEDRSLLFFGPMM